MKLFLIILIFVVCILFMLLFGVSFVIFRMAAKKHEKTLEINDESIKNYGVDAFAEDIKGSIARWHACGLEKVSITSFDGTLLRGVYAKAKEPRYRHTFPWLAFLPRDGFFMYTRQIYG